MANKDQEKLWTTKELAEAAELNPSRIRQLLLRGRIRGQRVGRDWAVLDRDARKWLKSRGIEI